MVALILLSVSYTHLSGGDGQTLGVVLTPKHITELFTDLAEATCSAARVKHLVGRLDFCQVCKQLSYVLWSKNKDVYKRQVQPFVICLNGTTHNE